MIGKLFSKKSSAKTNPPLPDFSIAETFQTAMQWHQTGDLAKAQELYQRILHYEPNHSDALHLSGVLAYQSGHYALAVELINQAIALQPSIAMYANLAVVFQAAGNVEQLIKTYQQSLLLENNAEIHYKVANLLQSAGRLDEAVNHYRQALLIIPDSVNVLNNLGVAFQTQKKFDEAIDCFQRILALSPEFIGAYNNLGIIFQTQKRFEQAVQAYHQAIALNPDYVEAHHNLANTLQLQERLDEAVASYKKTIALNPNLSEVPNSLGLLLLKMGRLMEGWQYCEARYKEDIKARSTIPPNLPFPQWQGESLKGKSLVIWYEQGLGDEIQFCRYVSVLKSQGVTKITWVCKKPLKSLLKTLQGVDTVLTAEEKSLIKPHDYWTFAMSIPLHCQTTLETIPANVPYLFANPKQQDKIASQLQAIKELKVGVCWKGNPGHKNDINRSPGIAVFQPLFDMPGVKFFNLQPDTRQEFLQNAGRSGVDRGHEIDKSSFDEAAALIMNLDLVITCDTSICHLAGALGKPVWIVLPLFMTDWRWLIDREDCPWYPSARLFRQTTDGDWNELFQRVERQLQEVIANHQNPQ